MSRNLIIYYSRKGQNYVNGSIRELNKGNTEIVAEFIQKAVGGDREGNPAKQPDREGRLLRSRRRESENLSIAAFGIETSAA